NCDGPLARRCNELAVGTEPHVSPVQTGPLLAGSHVPDCRVPAARPDSRAPTACGQRLAVGTEPPECPLAASPLLPGGHVPDAHVPAARPISRAHTARDQRLAVGGKSQARELSFGCVNACVLAPGVTVIRPHLSDAI